MAGKALLVLETPWWTPDQNKRRASVLPFLQGMANYLEHFSVYHSYFYERKGFKAALVDDLSNTTEDRLYIYIAAHGSGKSISEIKLSTILSEIRTLSRRKAIEGLLIGSCEIGKNVQDFKDGLIGTGIAWIFGYTCDIDWMGSMVIDLSIFEETIGLSSSVMNNRTRLINSFVKALKKFDRNYPIGFGDSKGTKLKDAITLVIRPRGMGKLPHDETDALKKKLGWI